MDWQNAIFAPGWVWSMLSMVLVVGSLVGLYRQLRLQGSQGAIDQPARVQQEGTSERMLRHQLNAWIARRDLPDPTAVPFAARYGLANFWEKVGTLAKAGHVDPKLLWDLFGDEIGECWTLLAPGIKASQARNHDPSLFEHFEWLAGAVTRFVPAGPSVPDQGRVREVASARVGALLGLIDVEQSLRTVMIASPEAAPAPPTAT